MSYSGTKSGYYYSLALHASCALAFVVFGLVSELFKTETEPPVVFQMVDQSPEPPAPTPKAEQKAEPQEIKLPDLKPIDPIDLPDPEPEPEQKPDPKPEPTPAPSPKPTPKPVIEKPKPKTMSYKDFLKNNPKKQTKSQTRVSKPQKINYQKVSANMSSFNAADARITRSGGDSRQMQDALSAYVQYIHSQSKSNWVIPSSIVGMELIVKIQFSVSGSGAISGVRILESSGNSDFDNSVVNLFRVLKLMPPPDAKSHNISLKFRSETQ